MAEQVDTGPFEGVEKRMIVKFTPAAMSHALYGSLRAAPIELWQDLLQETKVSILSDCRCDDVMPAESDPERELGWAAYLLSESSLFVNEDSIVLKTCGTSSLLLVLDQILGRLFSGEPRKSKNMQDITAFFTYTHINFAFPEEQRYPHRSPEEENSFIQHYFPDVEHLSLCTCRGSTFSASIFVNRSFSDRIVVNEAIMRGVTNPQELMECGSGQGRGGSHILKERKHSCGHGHTLVETQGWIKKTMDPDERLAANSGRVVALLDEFWFKPCGYSCNAVDEKGRYVTLHVSPEPETSYASLEAFTPFKSTRRHDLLPAIEMLQAEEVHMINLQIFGKSTGPEEESVYLPSEAYEVGRVTCVSGSNFKITAAVHTSMSPAKNFHAGKPESLTTVEPDSASTHCCDAISDDPKDLTPTSGISDGDEESTPDWSRSLSDLVIGAGGYCVDGLTTGVSKELLAIIEKESPDLPLLMVDIESVVHQWRRWQSNLPMIEPFYAVKCNDDPVLLRTLALLGSNFDCASPGEMRSVLDIGRPNTQLIYSNPCKQICGLQFARGEGVSLMVFDNEDELQKIAEHFPEAQLLLRIHTDDSDSQCPMSGKFGAPPSQWEGLLHSVKRLGLDLVGVDFHVGSGCSRLGAFTQALQSCKRLFDLAASHGLHLRILDIGGGFSGDISGWAPEPPTSSPSFEELAKEIREAIGSLFPCNVKFISEPGRFFASASHTLAVKIFARRGVIPPEKHIPNLKVVAPRLSEETNEIKQHDLHSTSPTSNAMCTPQSSAAFLSEDPKELGEDWKMANCNSDMKTLYYINDSIYGSFNCLLYDHAVVVPEVLRSVSNSDELSPAIVFGQTCDGLDWILRDARLPDLQVGDWLMFRNMGAYTVSAASNFNGFSKPLPRYIRLIDSHALSKGAKALLSTPSEEKGNWSE